MGFEGMDHTDGAVGVLDPEDAKQAVPDPEPDRTDPTAVRRSSRRQVRFITAICSFGAGLLHLLAMIDHRGSPDPGALLPRGRRDPDRVGCRCSSSSRGKHLRADRCDWRPRARSRVWVFSRTKGISWFPGLEAGRGTRLARRRDAVLPTARRQRARTIVLLPASVFKPAGKRVEALPIAIFAVFAMAVMAVLYAATHGSARGTTRDERTPASRISSVRAQVQFVRDATSRRVVRASSAAWATKSSGSRARISSQRVFACGGPLDVDVLGQFGDVGEDHHPVVATTSTKPPCTANSRRDAVLELTSSIGQVASAPRNGACPVQERDVAAAERAHDRPCRRHPRRAPARARPVRTRATPVDIRLTRLLQRLGLGEHRLDAADVEERLLGHVVELAAARAPRSSRPSLRPARRCPSGR